MIKLLLVEDNEINLDMIQRRLRKKFEMVVARNGLEAGRKGQDRFAPDHSDGPRLAGYRWS